MLIMVIPLPLPVAGLERDMYSVLTSETQGKSARECFWESDQRLQVERLGSVLSLSVSS